MRMSDKTLVYAALLSICLSFQCKSTSKLSPQSQGSDELLPWIHDDYPQALKESEAKGLPIVIDFWAAWCHTCLSMKHTVLQSKELKKVAGDAIWLAVDTENPANQDILDVYTITVWPTFLIVDDEENTSARLLGSTSVDGFMAFLDRGFKSTKATSSKSHLSLGDSEAAKGNFHEASQHYQNAATTLPKGSIPSPEVMLAWVESLHRLERYDECAQVGTKRQDAVYSSLNATLADYAYFLTDCQKRVKAPDLQNTRLQFITLIENLLKNRTAKLSTDDRSEALRMLRNFYVQEESTEKAKTTAERQKHLLDKAVKNSKTPYEAMTYSFHRMDVYSYLGNIKDMIPWFKSLTQQLPEEYDPPYRLASVYNEIENHTKALEYAALAQSRAEGPRRARVLSFTAKIHAKTKAFDAAIKAQNEALKIYQRQPQTPRNAKTLKKQRAELLRLQSLQEVVTP